MVDQNYFFRRRPFLANKNVTFAKLSRTPHLSFAGPMLGNKKIRSPPAKLRQRITDHFLIAFLNTQLASRNPLSGQVVADQFFFARSTDPPPSTCTLTSARSFGELSRNFCKNNPIHRPRPSAEGASKEKRTPGALVFGSRKASLLETWLLHLELVS